MAYAFPKVLTKMSTQTASSSASISFTSLISSIYTNWVVDIRDVIPATNNTNLLLTLSTDNGSTYLTTGYSWVNHNTTSAAGSAASGSASTSSIQIASALSNTSSNGFSGTLNLFDLGSSSYRVNCDGVFVHHDQGSNFAHIRMSGQNSSTSATTAIKFAMSSGNITSGSFILYGAVY